MLDDTSNGPTLRHRKRPSTDATQPPRSNFRVPRGRSRVPRYAGSDLVRHDPRDPGRWDRIGTETCAHNVHCWSVNAVRFNSTNAELPHRWTAATAAGLLVLGTCQYKHQSRLHETYEMTDRLLSQRVRDLERLHRWEIVSSKLGLARCGASVVVADERCALPVRGLVLAVLDGAVLANLGLAWAVWRTYFVVAGGSTCCSLHRQRW